jgi:hypothetical protein
MYEKMTKYFEQPPALDTVPMRNQTLPEKLTSGGTGQHKPKQRVAKYRGVVLDTHTGKWHALIMVRKQEHHLGTYETPEQAAAAYNREAVKFFGSAAVLNVMPTSNKRKPKATS